MGKLREPKGRDEILSILCKCEDSSLYSCRTQSGGSVCIY